MDAGATQSKGFHYLARSLAIFDHPLDRKLAEVFQSPMIERSPINLGQGLESTTTNDPCPQKCILS